MVQQNSNVVPIDKTTGNFKVLQQSFFDAGQASYVQPPAQEAGMFERFWNIQTAQTGDLTRRPGYRLFSAASLAARRSYIYQKDEDGSRRLVFTHTSNIIAVNEDGSSYNTNIFTPSGGAGQPRAVLSRSYLYIVDGVSGDAKKWDGSASGGVSNWGHTTPGDTSTSLTLAGAGADDSSVGSVAWTNPGNITASDNTYAVMTLTPGQTSHYIFAQSFFGSSTAAKTAGTAAGTSWTTPGNTAVSDNAYATYSGTAQDVLKLTNFSFSLPASTHALGFQVVIEGNGAGTASADRTIEFAITKDGATAAGDWQQVVLPLTTDSTQTFGGSTAMFGVPAATKAEVESSNFGVLIRDHDTTGALNLNIDFVSLKVFYGYLPATAVITGIEVDIEANVSGTASFVGTAYIMKGGSVMTSATHNFTQSNFSGADSTYVLGGSTDLWSQLVFTQPEISDSGFGVALKLVAGGSGSVTFNVDAISMKIYYRAPLTVGAATTGGVDLNFGRTYLVAFKNSVTGHAGNLSPASDSTGQVTAGAIPLSNIPVSTDSQIDRKLILATADGDDQTTLYLLADIPNSQTTLTDNIAEDFLLDQPIFQETDAFGIEHGIADNTPPPLGTVPFKHKGRLWLIHGQYLYFSKNLEEVTNSDGMITSRYEEAWPADYNFDIAEGAETPKALLSDGEVLYIGTEKTVRKLFGSGPTDFQKPEVLFNNVGVLSQEVWQECYVEGAPIGCMWLTPDYRVMGSDMRTYRDVGFSIQDVLNTINVNAQANAFAFYTNHGNKDQYILCIPTGSNTDCDTACVFDLQSKKWAVWFFADSLTSALYNIQANGVPQTLLVASTGTIYQIDDTLTQDRVNNTPVNITATLRTTWTCFTDPLLRKYLNEIELMGSDAPNMTATLHGASTYAEFQSPTVVKTGTPVAGPLGEYKFYLAGASTKDRWYRLTLTSSSTVKDFLDSVSYDVFPMHYI